MSWISGIKSLLQLERPNLWKPWSGKEPYSFLLSYDRSYKCLAQKGYSLLSCPSLDSADIETWLWEPSEGGIQVSASLHCLSAICMSVHMAKCVTHAQRGWVFVCGCLFIFPLSQTPARSSVSTWQWMRMQPRLLWMPAPVESLPLDAGATLTTDDVGNSLSPISPPHHVYLCLICLPISVALSK